MNNQLQALRYMADGKPYVGRLTTNGNGYETVADTPDIETARLFAAAPELLAALRELLDTSVPCPGSVSMDLNARGQAARTRVARLLHELER